MSSKGKSFEHEIKGEKNEGEDRHFEWNCKLVSYFFCDFVLSNSDQLFELF